MTRHLVLALSTKGFGETILGLQAAQVWQKRGDEIHFLVHPGSASIVANAGFSYQTVTEKVGFLLPLFVREAIAVQKSQSIVLADYFTTDLWLLQNGLGPECLTDFGLPITAIDTWHMAKSGTSIDIYWQKHRKVRDWRDQVAKLIQPAPIAAPSAPGAYCSMPDGIAPLACAQVQRQRSELGLKQSDRAILFCTAHWQQTQYTCDNAQRSAAMLPQLIAQYVAKLGQSVKFIHVGPKRYTLDLGNQYIWIDQMPQQQFKNLLGASDLLLNANISSTTIARAMAMEVPVLSLINSRSLATPQDVAQLAFAPLSDGVSTWILDALPMSSFAMWPVGYADFLQPLREDNPYFKALVSEEVLNEASVLDKIDKLLNDTSFRKDVVSRQNSYIAAIHQLPAPCAAEMSTA